MNSSTTSPTNLNPSIVAGSRVERTDGRVGTVTRIIATEGNLGGLVEVRWDGERRPSRTSGFEAGNNITLLG